MCLSEFVCVRVGVWKKESRIIHAYVGAKSESSRLDQSLTQFDLLTPIDFIGFYYWKQ